VRLLLKMERVICLDTVIAGYVLRSGAVVCLVMGLASCCHSIRWWLALGRAQVPSCVCWLAEFPAAADADAAAAVCRLWLL
jgi:hypothetical protein